MIKAVIFDMDGVLIDSEPFWREAEIKVLSKVGVPIDDERAKETMGLRVDEVVEYWYSRYPWEGTTQEELASQIVEGVINLVKEKGQPLNGVHKTIEAIMAKNLPLAIASSSNMDIIQAVMGKLELDTKIKILHSAQHESYGKPHPGVYITAAEKLGISTDFCLAIEDSPNGVLAAKAAKMKCIAVPDKSIKDDKRFMIADMIIDSLEDFSLDKLESFQ